MLKPREGHRLLMAMNARTSSANDGMARPTLATDTARNCPLRLCPTKSPTGIASADATATEMADSST